MMKKINTDYNDELKNFRLDFQKCASGDQAIHLSLIISTGRRTHDKSKST